MTQNSALCEGGCCEEAAVSDGSTTFFFTFLCLDCIHALQSIFQSDG